METQSRTTGLDSRAPVPVPTAAGWDPLGTDAGGWGEEVPGAFLSTCHVQLTKGQSKRAVVLSGRLLVWVRLVAAHQGPAWLCEGQCLSGIYCCHIS